MKLKLIIALFATVTFFQSCTKCVTCVPYHYTMGKITSEDNIFQAIKLCDHQDITNYENTNFADAGTTDTVKFICK